jgi:YlmC/YmxH family sporulation protein
MVKTADLKTKPVIEINDGRSLGIINDIEFDIDSGRVTGIVVPSADRSWSFFRQGGTVVIPWEEIVRIGTDVILVSLRKSEAAP